MQIVDFIIGNTTSSTTGADGHPSLSNIWTQSGASFPWVVVGAPQSNRPTPFDSMLEWVPPRFDTSFEPPLNVIRGNLYDLVIDPIPLAPVICIWRSKPSSPPRTSGVVQTRFDLRRWCNTSPPPDIAKDMCRDISP